MKTVVIAFPSGGGRNENYFAAVAACGAAPLLLGADDPAGCIARADALLLPGGGDLDSALYGEPNRACGDVDPDLDALQLRALDAAVSQRKPVLGICRGLQLINVYFGGSLFQDLPNAPVHRWLSSTRDNVHPSRAEPDSFLVQAFGQTSIPVNSAHHQGIKVLGRGLRGVQYSEDGLIEGLCHRDLPIWAVQWHPERMCLSHARADTVDGLKLLRLFVESL